VGFHMGFQMKFTYTSKAASSAHLESSRFVTELIQTYPLVQEPPRGEAPPAQPFLNLSIIQPWSNSALL
jgi:hypothetical protein